MKAHFKAFITIISFLDWWSCSTDDGIEDDPPVMIGPAIQWQKSLGGSMTDEYPII